MRKPVVKARFTTFLGRGPLQVILRPLYGEHAYGNQQNGRKGRRELHNRRPRPPRLV